MKQETQGEREKNGEMVGMKVEGRQKGTAKEIVVGWSR